MASETQWSVQGEFFESCSCDFVCPCIPSNFSAPMTNGQCNFAFVFQVERGNYGDVGLDGLNFAVVGHMPGATADAGNWSVGLILDERAGEEQQQALTAIASGQAGGPMAAVSGLIGNFLGVESRPITFQKNGLNRSVSVPGVLDLAIDGVPGANPDEPLYIDNTIHPANSRVAMAKSSRSHMHVFGIDWDEDGGQNNGHFAPFQWSGS